MRLISKAIWLWLLSARVRVHSVKHTAAGQVYTGGGVQGVAGWEVEQRVDLILSVSREA